MQKMFSYKDIFGDKKRILVIMAHPDDADVFWGGLIKRLTDEHKEVSVLVAVNGARGSRDMTITETELAKMRQNEEITALGILGVHKNNIRFLDYNDGELNNNYETIGKFVENIREFQPEIVCTHDPQYVYFSDNQANGWINHRDHRMTGLLVADAVYPFCRDVSFFPEQIKKGLKSASPTEILFTSGSKTNAKMYISKEEADAKVKALKAHASQFSEDDAQGSLDYWKDEDGVFEEGNWLRLEW